MISHTQASSTAETRRQATGRSRISRGVLATRASSPYTSGSGASALGRVRLGALGLTIVLVLLLVSVCAAGAQAAGYTAGSPLAAGSLRLPSGVAVNQSSHDVYVASCGSESLGLKACSAPGGFQEFSSVGSEIACSLEGAPEHPSSVAVDPENGNIYVLQDEATASASKIFTYGSACGAKLGEFTFEASASRVPPQAAVDSSGDLFSPSPSTGKVQKCTPAGVCTELVTGLNRPASVAFDSAGDLYVASGATTTYTCSNNASGKLVKYKPNGSGGFTEVGTFASLSSNVTTVAVDRKTNEVFVGRNCGETFKVEKYSAGGVKLSEFGSGFATGSGAIFNQIAVDETSGKVYVTDNGNFQTQVYNAPAQYPLTLSTTGTGTVKCQLNGGGITEICLSEYDEGTIVKLIPVSGRQGSTFKEWGGGCSGSGACEVTMTAGKTVSAVFQSRYTAGSPLAAGSLRLPSGVAVNQSSHDVYVASCGSESLGLKACSAPGGFQEFSSVGSEIACSLEGAPEHPSSVAVDPENGNIYVLQDEATASASKIFTYGSACGAKLGEFTFEASASRVPPQAAVDSSGDLFSPSPSTGKVQKCTPAGVCTELVTGLNRPASVAFDSAGDLYVASGATTTYTCSNNASGKLVKYKPNGSGGFTEVGTFASLSSNVTTVAVDRKTNEVFVGRNCGETFKVEKYSAGGVKLSEFGSGFATGSGAIFNQIAVDETSGKVYVTDNGNFQTQVYPYTAPSMSALSVSTTGAEGSVVCEVEGHEEPACASEYETGTEVTVKAVKGAHSSFVKWSAATGAAASCVNLTTSCTFTLSSASSVNAEFAAFPKRRVSVTVTGTGEVGAAQGSLSGCTSAGGASCEEERYEGEKVVLTATHNANNHFVTWGASACENVGHDSEEKCEFEVRSSAVAATAEFASNGFLLTIEKEGSGSVTVASVQSGLGLEPIACGAHCSELFTPGTMVELTATPQAGSQFVGWSTTAGSPGTCTGTTSPCIVTVSEATTLKATSSLEPETLNVSESGPGTVECEFAHSGSFGACTSPQPYGTSVKVKATPSTGAEVTSLSGTGSASTCSTGGCEFEITEASSVTVVFALESEALSVSESGPGTVECEFAHSGSYGPCTSPQPYGTSVSVRSTPNTGAEVTSLSGTGSASGCSTGGCAFEIKQASSVTVAFGLEPEALTVSESGPGSVECEFAHSGSYGPCTTPQPYGTNVSVKATPDTGGELTSLSGTGSASGCSTSGCEFEIKQATSVTVLFTAESEALTVNESGPGTVECEFAHSGSSGPCTTPQPYGTNVKVTPRPNTGAELSSLSGTGSASGCSTSSCGFEIKQASSVTVEFAAIAHPSTLVVFKGGGGKGTVTSLSPHTGITCGPSCEEAQASFEEGQTVELEASASTGSVFAGWIGCRHQTATTCQVKLDAPEVEVTAVFLTEGEKGAAGETPTVTEFTGAKGPCGEGGIEVKVGATTAYACNGAKGTNGTSGETPTVTQFTGAKGTCTEGGVEVKVGASTTYVCDGVKGTNGTSGTSGETPTTTQFTGAKGTCTEGGVEVKVGASTTYVCDGVKGTNGTSGETPTVTQFTGAKGTCTNGGVEVKVGVSTTYVCSGVKGEPGQLGNPGFPGEQGEQGPAGPAGQSGAQGAKGDTGSTGAQGATGAQGKEGPAGLNGKVTCTVKQKKGKKTKVTCTVKYTTPATSSALRRTLRWVLVRHGHVVEHGKSRGMPHIRLGALHRGRYTLYLQGQHQGTVIHVG